MSTTTTRVTQSDLIGQPVIIKGQEGTFIYDGPDTLGFETIKFGAGERGLRVATSFDRIAPADTTIPDADARITIEKRPMAEARRAGHYGRGSWAYTVADDFKRTFWANTKKEALANGLRRLAIFDWHAANGS